MFDMAEHMSEAQLQLAMKASQVGMWDWDLVTNQLVWTDQKKALFGLPHETPVSYELFLEAVHPDDRERVHQLNLRAIKEQREYSKDYRTIWPDGSVHWLSDRARVLFDGNGKPVRVIGATVDITELKQTEQRLRDANQQVTSILESITDAFLHVDTQWRYTFVNQGLEKLMGKKREEILGRVMWDVVPSIIGTPFEQTYREAFATQQPMHIEGFHPDFRRWVEVHVYPAPDGISFYLHDITERKESERQKDLFLGMTSHELKTPLAALKGTFQLLQRRVKRLSPQINHLSPELSAFFQDLTERLAASDRQVDVQTHLINDLLDVSRITANTLQLDLERCDLASIVRETTEDLRVTAPERTLTLDVPEHPAVIVLADRDRIGQVVTNYVTNAIRYSPSDQPIHIGLSTREGTARVWVRDHGPGLTPEAQSKLWKSFHQVEGVPVQSGTGKGLGLGLYICQTLIAQHQGKVGVESAPGEGSTFWFTLPLLT